MGILDRLRSQPRWQHPDAAIRIAALQELSDDEQDVLASIARDDADAQVRRAAIRRVQDPAVLAAAAGADADEDVRGMAREALVELARGGNDDASADAALAGLSQERDVAEVAKTAARESVSRRALEKLSDVKALGSVARRSRHAAVRLAALARVADPAELAAIAIRSDEKDVALAALERLAADKPGDRDALKTIASRARNKIVGRRAKALVRALDRAAAPAADPQAHRRELCALVESLASSTDWDHARDELAEARAAWAEEPRPDDEAAGEEIARRFARACEAVEAQLARHDAEEAERQRLMEQRSAAVAERVALCEAVEALEGEAAPARLAAARAAWAALGPVPEDDGQADALQRRFDRAAAACGRRYERWQAGQARRARLAQLADEAAPVVEIADVRAARARWGALQREWVALKTAAPAAPGSEAEAPLQARWQQAEARLRAREAEARAARAREQQENLARVEALCAELEKLARAETPALRDVERGLREARAAIDNPGPFPTRHDRDAIVARLKAAQAALVPRARDLREVEEWQRWANLNVQEELCKCVEALGEINDLPLVAKRLREALDEWRKAAAAPKDQADALWRRFKAAYDAQHARCETFFARQAAERQGNLKLKLALCEQAESLAESTDWVRTAQHFERLQVEWKQVGPVPHDQAQAVWKRFRTACDRFFTRRKTDLARRKGEWAKNLERKEALCARVEALAESTDWEAAAAEIKRLQAEWKTIGPVKKTRSEAIWQRFRAACDRFFERYNQREALELADQIADREAVCVELESFAPPAGATEPGPPRDGLAGAVIGARTRWLQTAPLPRPREQDLDRRYLSALLRLIETYPSAFRGTELDPEANRRKMEKLCARVEAALPAGAAEELAGASPAEILVKKWREALAANTLGVKVDEEAKWRAAAEEVRQAQAAWRRLGPVPGDTGRSLAERFHRACDRFFSLRDRHRCASAPQGAR